MLRHLCHALTLVTIIAATGGALAAANERPESEIPTVLNGIDVLVRDDFAPLKERRIGLITNHTGIDRHGRATIELLHDADGIDLVALFSPEHGIEGTFDQKVGHGTHDATGLPVYSLYGETRRPTSEMLENIDTLVFDIQDIGTRFYTYIATMGNAMEEAAQRGIRFVVLDRPNPITGTRVFGPFNDTEGRFTAYMHMPLVHGMTVGELAKMFQQEKNIAVDLQVIEMDGWQRSMWYDETGLPWVNPSPNMRSLTQATLYPAIGMIEACDVSVGRGTDTPFELFGAPYFNALELAYELNKLEITALRFIPFHFTPNVREYRGQKCAGVQIILLDREAFDPAQAGLAIAAALEKIEPAKFNVENVNNLIFNKAIVAELDSADPMKDWSAGWQKDMRDFMQMRKKYLLYE